MKFKVFFITIGLQLLLTVFVLWPPIDRLSVRLFLFIGLLAWLIVRFITAKRLYLTDLSIVGNRLELQYITSQLISKKLVLVIDDVNRIKVSRAQFPYEYTGAVRIHTKEQWYTVLILNKKIYDKAEQALNADNIQLC